MTMRLVLATVWILAGGALTGGIYWLFLITPESTVWALLASAVLGVAALAMAGFTASGAIAVWSYGASIDSIRRAARAIPAVVPAAALAWSIGWLATYLDTWFAMRSGPINAWFIAQWGWDDASWFFTSIRYLVLWLRWVVAALLAWSLIAGVVTVGWAALGQAAWLRRALRPRGLALATFWAVILIAVPWSYLVPWRPSNLPASSMQLAFIVVKLSVSAILFGIGLALIALQVSTASTKSHTPTETAQVA